MTKEFLIRILWEKDKGKYIRKRQYLKMQYLNHFDGSWVDFNDMDIFHFKKLMGFENGKLHS